jgi:hypothetical protein
MSHIEASKLPQFDADEKVQEAIDAFNFAKTNVESCLSLIAEHIKFLHSNWDEEYEERLRQSGFRGSLFILRDYSVHLETLYRLIEPQIVSLQSFQTELRTGAIPNADNPLMGSSTRGLCRALITFLDFEDSMAQTQLVNYSLRAARRAKT